jgi:hypothetical protein
VFVLTPDSSELGEFMKAKFNFSKTEFIFFSFFLSLVLFFETESCYIPQAGLKFMIFLL